MMRIVQENNILEPYVIVIGSPGRCIQAFIVIDGKLICEINDNYHLFL